MKPIKSISVLILLMTCISVLGQYGVKAINGYKYAIVAPLIYNNDRRDIYSIESKSVLALKSLGITCLDPIDHSKWPKEVISEPCNTIYFSFDVGVAPNFFNCGSIKIIAKDCKGSIIFEENQRARQAVCNEPYDCCYPKWAIAAESFFSSLNYKYNPDLNTLKTTYPNVEYTPESEESLRNYYSNNVLDPIEGIYKSYQNDQLTYYKFGIKKYGNLFKAIIIESDLVHWKPGEVKAVIELSSMKGFYSVKWYMGNKTPYETFGNLENEAILIIEFKDQKTGEKTQNKFIRLFPSTSNEITFKKDNVKASGSGFFLTTDGIIATNAHVVDGASNIEVTVSNEIGNYTYSAKVLLSDSRNDVALLQINDEKFKGLNSIPYGITENSDVGSKVFTIGFPLNDVMGSNYKVSDGIISSKSGITDDVRYYQISVPLQPGNSGGPLFNKEGNVIGITSAKLNSEAVGVQIENVNYAIKSSYLLSLYNMLPNATKLSSGSQVASQELQDQVKVLKNYVCLIKIF